ncbi:hypothetical protein AX16_000090 [Volvariella volvacea WC 439]|nr:hypothetical protein AX16_000090 [Volvariella volvacea WC 439]
MAFGAAQHNALYSAQLLRAKPSFDTSSPLMHRTDLESSEEEIILLYMDERAASLHESDVDDTASSCAPSSFNEDQFPTPILPSDIWFTIAMFLSPADVASLALTCTAICGIVQPFVFQSLLFRPTVSRYHSKRAIDHLKDRLDYLTSEFIAPVVRSIVISGDGGLHEEAFSCIFSRLDVWPSLTHITLRSIHLNYPTLAAMCLMEDALECAIFEDCSTGEDLNEAHMMLPVQTLKFDCSPSELAGPPKYLFEPNILQHLAIGPSCGKTMFTSIVSSYASFANLTRLSIPISVLYEPVAVPALLKCPKVQSISISTAKRASKTSINLPPGVLPRLVEYDGPYDLAPIFSLGRCIRKYTLWPMESEIFCESSRIREMLGKLCPTTESLDLGFITQVGFSFVNTVAAAFPKLKSLSLNAHPEFCPGFTNLRDFTLLLSDSKFPLVKLEELSVGIQFNPGAGGQDAIVDLINNFISRCYNARAARVVYGHHPDDVCVSWRRPRDARQVPRIQDNLYTVNSSASPMGVSSLRSWDNSHRPHTV